MMGGKEGRMDDLKSIITYRIGEYGQVTMKLSDIMNRRGITRNRLATLTGIKYGIVDRYYKGTQVAWVDLDFLAKVCYVLDCGIDDLLEYQKPDSQSSPE